MLRKFYNYPTFLSQPEKLSSLELNSNLHLWVSRPLELSSRKPFWKIRTPKNLGDRDLRSKREYRLSSVSVVPVALLAFTSPFLLTVVSICWKQMLNRLSYAWLVSPTIWPSPYWHIVSLFAFAFPSGFLSHANHANVTCVIWYNRTL